MSYYEKRIAYLEARVAEMALQQRMKAIPVEAQLLDRIKELKAEVEHLTSENLLVREEADRYCRLWQEAKEGKV
jgi:hypothetical protein